MSGDEADPKAGLDRREFLKASAATAATLSAFSFVGLAGCEKDDGSCETDADCPDGFYCETEEGTGQKVCVDSTGCSACSGSSVSSTCTSCTGGATSTTSCTSCTGGATSTTSCTSCTGSSTSSGCSGCGTSCSASCKDSCHSSCSGTCSGGCKNMTS